MKKEEILRKICDWYDYEVKEENGQYVIDNGCSDYSLEFVGKRAEIGHFEYKHIDEALKDWLDTLEETNKDQLKEQQNPIWTKEIKFIRSLCRRTASSVMEECGYSIEKTKKIYKKCGCCGFYHKKGEGIDQIKVEDCEYFDICKECLQEIELGRKFEEIPFNREWIDDYELEE